jgi:transposase
MSEKFIIADRDQQSLLPYDLRDWIPEDDLVHFVIEAVEELPLAVFSTNKRGTGSSQYHPHMMLSLLIYCYANGIFGSRRIERATYRDIAVRYLCANKHPDHDTICKFRRENFEAVSMVFLEVLKMARAMKILKVGTISVDGTKIKANASKDKNVRYDRAGELEEQLKLDIASLMQKAEETDASEEDDGQKLPKEIASREKLRDKMQRARKVLEEQAKVRAAAEQEEYEKKVASREERQGRRKGKKIQPPDDKPRDKDQVNLTDSDSRLMRRSKTSEFHQSYNTQAVVDTEGTQLILGVRTSQCASDSKELYANVQAVSLELGKPSRVLADCGYVNEADVNALEKENIDVLLPIHREDVLHERVYDFRPKSVIRKGKSIGPQSKDWIVKMAEKMETKTVKEIYRLRKQTVEPVFGIVKQVMGFRQFLLRGVEKVSGEWKLVATAYNFKRLYNLKSA